ncbi:hypothetical protein MARPO_0010s0177 [Marchantia polymorpha]|uniref:Transcription initiation factor TFIID subunit 1 n=1 Tax=Marchantia polymorpha TaxID=3197 RepID=A0A2R6XL66_MARPO|nr:hypothetical protein MARPO_0010s0177 [Marchantia polymorpha]|eukprot:PTQ46806.1 hypothetical protein MARPO_0010s0177 [Marchantia polymorpha]
MGDLLRNKSAYESDDEKAEEENEEEDEENGERGRGRMLGFMFGNVDDAGDLDEEYLDQDAKEHLSALADQLGPSLVDMELSAKWKRSAAGKNAEEEQEDYAKKAEDAVDYEDIQEEYDGPEVQLLPQEEQFYAQAAIAGPSRKLADEDNYDEEEEEEPAEGNELVTDAELVDVSLAEPEPEEEPVILPVAKEGDLAEAAKLAEVSEVREEAKEEDLQTKTPLVEEEQTGTKPQDEDSPKIELPVLCEEDGKEVLWFSEIFGDNRPYYWLQLGIGAGRQKRHTPREKVEWAEEEDEALEEDEEEVFKSCPYRHPTGDDLSSIEIDKDEDDGVEEEEQESSAAEEDTSEPSPETEGELKGGAKGRRFEFYSSQAMKGGTNDWEELSQWRDSIPSANFVAIHQQDWEANILWDKVENRGVKLRELRSEEEFSEGSIEVESESDEDMIYSRIGQKTSRQSQRNPLGMSNEPERSVLQEWNRPVTVEPLSRPHLKSSEDAETALEHRHPQMLRLESLSIDTTLPDIEGKGEGDTSDLGSRLNKLSMTCSQKNRELASGSWLDNVLWDHDSPSGDLNCERPKFIYDLQDGEMVFEIPNNKWGQTLRVHAAAVVLSPTGGKDGGVEGGEVVMHAASSIARFNISNDKYYTNKKTHQQQKSHAKKRAVHGVKVMHSLPAIKLQTMKPKLTNKDLANFHRPKAVWYPHHNEVAAKEQGKLAVKGSMKVILKTLGGKGSKLYVDASETVEVLKAKAAKKLGDLKASEKTKLLYSGKELEEGRTFAEQEVPPNSVLHLVRTRICPWPKAQRLPGENKPIRPPGAFKKKSELSVKDGHVALMEYCEERPLLLSNVGMGARLSTYYRKSTPTDTTAATLRNERGPWVGVPLPLEPTEDSPFLGDIRQGDTVSSLETNMYRSPAFSHKVPHTDFLLVRSAKGKLSLRRIDSLHVVGQQEPHMEVLTPTSKTVQYYIGMRLLVYVYREFRANEKPSSVPRVRADELISQFPALTEGFIRKRLKHCADLQKGPGGEMWWVMRRNFRIPSEEELRRMVTPEMVCTYESMQAGLHHLKRMGVQKLTQPSGLSAAMNMLPDEAITLAAASHIERELQITPWNLSSNFVSATLQGRGSLERLEITGAGDPSGRGLGFSYLRVATKPPNVGAIVEKKAAVARGGGAVTGTDADLRRLSMDAAREVLLKFKVSEAQIDKLTRWHRIALVRKLSSEQAASGVKVGVAALNKFARGQRMSFMQLQQQTREKCQEIWDRQAQSLAAAEGEDSESDGEANGDLDSFAGDLENLLEAEEGEDGEERKGRKDGMRGLGARRRALQAQKEEEMEDEEAEAAELRRMLLEDDEAEEEQKKKKSGTVSKEKKVAQPKEANGAEAEASASAAKKKRRILKRIIRTKKPDGTYTSREIIIDDPKEVALYLAKKNSLKTAGQKTTGDKVNVPKKGAAKPKKEKKPPVIKDAAKPKAPAKKVTSKEGGKEKPGRDGLRVVCGACGQLGHMRTNKKCPLYMEDSEGNLQRHDSAAAEGLLERQGTKITIKKKKIDELQLNKPTQPMKVTPKKPVKAPTPTVKFPALKIKIQSAAKENHSESSLGNNGSKLETNSITKERPQVAEQEKPIVKSPLVGDDLKFSQGFPPEKIQGNKLKIMKKNKKKKVKEKAPVKQVKKPDEYYDQPGVGHSDSEFEKERELEAERQRLEMEREQEEREKEMEREREREREERERDRQRDQMRLQKRKEKMLEKQRKEKELEREEKEREERERLAQEQMEKDRLRELKEKKRQRIREEKERERLREEKEKERELQKELAREEKERARAREEMEREKERERLMREEKERQDRIERERAEKERERQEKLRLQRLKQEKIREEELQKERMQKARLEKEKKLKEKQKEEKLKEQKLLMEKPKIREKQIHAPAEKELRVREPPRETTGKKEKGRVLKKRAHTELGAGGGQRVDAVKRRKRGGEEVELSNHFESIVEHLKNSDVAYLFLKPVSKKEAPDYLDYVKKPMDLGLIRDKVRKMVYRCRDDFRADVEQIAENAHIYNDGRNPGIPPLADKLLDLCDSQLRLKKQEFEELEDALEGYEGDGLYAAPNGRVSPPLDRRRKRLY